MYVAEHDAKVYIFRATLSAVQFTEVSSPEGPRTGEVIAVYYIGNLLTTLGKRIIPNLHWLLPLQFEDLADLAEPVTVDVIS